MRITIQSNMSNKQQQKTIPLRDLKYPHYKHSALQEEYWEGPNGQRSSQQRSIWPVHE